MSRRQRSANVHLASSPDCKALGARPRRWCAEVAVVPRHSRQLRPLIFACGCGNCECLLRTLLESVRSILHADRVDEVLAAELASRMERDQAARNSVQRHAAAEAVDRLVEVDHDNTVWLRGVLGRVGWPGRSLVGEKGALAAWLLAQHADRDPEFQRECLTLLAAAVEAGEAEGSHLAYLTDRVSRSQGQPQVYGTQFWRGPDGTGPLVAQPIDDEVHIDERRASVGLEPLAAYGAHIRELYGDS